MFLTALLLGSLCTSGLLLVDAASEEGLSLRLVGGQRPCRGQLQIQRPGEDWTIVHPFWFSLELANRVCAEVDCGAALSVERTDIKKTAVVRLKGFCGNQTLSHCFKDGKYMSDESLQLNCSDSVRLVSGRNMCSGSLQIRDRSVDPSWSPVCAGALDRRGAEVVCRQLTCGAPVLQGELSTQSFGCQGNEPSLLDCPGPALNLTCPGPALNLTCTEPVRLERGPGRCEGTVEAEFKGEWRPILNFDSGRWDLEAAGRVCGLLGCGRAVTTEQRSGVEVRSTWLLRADCVRTTASVRDCIFAESNEPGGHSLDLRVKCSG